MPAPTQKAVEDAYDAFATEDGLDVQGAIKIAKELQMLQDACSPTERMQTVRAAFKEIDMKGNQTGKLSKKQCVELVGAVHMFGSRLVGGIVY